MKKYASNDIRNVCLIGHGGTGKTTLTEAFLLSTKVTTRMGSIQDGTTTGDYTPSELKKGYTINAKPIPIEWNKSKINFMDTPGFMDFIGEVLRTLKVCEGALSFVDAAAGVEVQTEITWEYADELNTPRLILVNKLDKEHADFNKAVTNIQETLSNKAKPFFLPIGKESEFNGVVDIIAQKAYILKDAKKYEFETTAIPADLEDEVKSIREELMEFAAESDEALMEKYFSEGELTEEELITGLKTAIKTCSVFPILCGSTEKLIGMAPLGDFITNFLPSPEEIEGLATIKGEEEKIVPINSEDDNTTLFVFKTLTESHIGEMIFVKICNGTLKQGLSLTNVRTENKEKIGQILSTRGKSREELTEACAGDICALVKMKDLVTNDTLYLKQSIEYKPINFPSPLIEIAVKPLKSSDIEKMASAFNKIMREDPTFSMIQDMELKQTLVKGMGEAHLESILSSLKEKYTVEVEVNKPKIPYRETIRTKAQFEYKHKKQTGGKGQYGHVLMEFEPLPTGETDQEFVFEDRVVGGRIPSKFIPAVEKGIVEAKAKGVLAGYPMIGFKAAVYDGSFHNVDSSEQAFKTASSMAFRRGIPGCKPVLLEPIIYIEILVPDEFTGSIMGDLNSRRARINGMDPIKGNKNLIRANVPQGEMYKYINELKAMTQGRGTFTQRFDHYEEVPNNVSEALIKELNAQREEEEEEE